MANIHDIARLSGFSVATVSRVINDRPYVSAEAKAAVMKVVRQLDYVPNAMARDLSAGHTMTIGVVTPMRDHPYFTSLTNSITRAAFARGYRVMLLPSQYDQAIEADYLEQLRMKAYDALIFISHALPLADILPYAKTGRVVVCHDPGQVKINAAFTDRGETYEEGCQWLKAHGAQKIGMFLPRSRKLSATSQAMLGAYAKVFGENLPANLQVLDVMNNEDGYQAAEQLAVQQVDAIFTNGDDIAAGAVQYYRELGLALPLFVGQENQLSSQLLNMPTIDHHFRVVGELALRLAVGELSGQHQVASTFIART